MKLAHADRLHLERPHALAADEVLAHLTRSGVELSVRIEIEAVKPDGFDEATIRTVRGLGYRFDPLPGVTVLTAQEAVDRAS